MRANLPDELMKAIDNKIYLDIELHIVNGKIEKARQEGKDGFANHLMKIYKQINDERISVNKLLKDNGIKVQEVEVLDEFFVRYHYYQKINGGFKEGYNQYWKSAMTFNLNNRLKRFFGGE
jgi:hypothetical protein